MDKFDQHIIQILSADARCSVSEIAKQVSLSRSAVTARIKRLEEERIITGYHAQISSRDTSAEICAYLALKFDTSSSNTHDCTTYAKSLSQIDGIRWCHGISGETDLMLYVQVPGMRRLKEIIDMIHQYPHLRQLVTHTVINEFFNHTQVEQK
ncbi:Leucine-responsive regulatory protein [Vibrio aerogenes CECT 7868]|uniref:Leucine-responsive regulatory protein n=1 Tax=Vibrio aerogenes CECT 7868 TaxID=1216006 RepID=A0A1M5ZX49_9VIBR|nr:Lrp/AsnC family transcriptional regulator [Vibrio aerogenes]SHI28834.1 Leucine-responsive regulatory protein [Vibrio aerogenes CECT 7868]